MGILFDSSLKEQIERLVSEGSTQAIRRRAKLLLLYDDGLTTVQVAEQVDLSTSRTRYWRRRFLSDGMAVFAEELPQPEEVVESTPDEIEDADPPTQEDTQPILEIFPPPEGKEEEIISHG